MKVNSIKIVNFQKHANLSLNFNDDINVITGLTDTGKSGVFRALQWVFNFSNISELDYRKENTKQTSVKIWLSNDFQVERIRSNSVNRYILSKEGTEDKIFDNFGKDTPEEVAVAFEIDTIDIENEHLNLNFSSQDQLNFLLDSEYSDTIKAKLFNKLTGNEILDSLFKQLNSDSRRFNRELSDTEELLNKQEEQLCECSLHYKTLKKKSSGVKEIYNNIKADLEIYEHLKELNEQLGNNNASKEALKIKIETIGTVSDKKLIELENKAGKLNKILDLMNKLEEINAGLEKIKSSKKHIKNFDFNNLIDQNNTVVLCKKLYSVIQKHNDIVQKINTKLKEIENNKIKLQETWDKNPTCPLCGKDKK